MNVKIEKVHDDGVTVKYENPIYKSITYNIYCKDCEEFIVVGTMKNKRFELYNSLDDIKILSAFMEKHEGHTLLFDSEYWQIEEDCNYEEFTG